MNRKRLDIVCEELSLSYINAGRRVADAELSKLALHLAETLPCRDDELHDVFVRARSMTDVPTYRVLCKAYSDMVADSPVVAALPRPEGFVDPVVRATFRREALKNFCIAEGTYDQFVYAMITRQKEKYVAEYVRPERAEAFTRSKVRLFSPMFYDWERGGPPPSVHEFRKFINGVTI